MKTKPMRIEEFAPEKAWWGHREESEQAWKVSVEQIKANGYNLDIKSPNTVADELGDPEELCWPNTKRCLPVWPKRARR
ncbi:MAG TPA: N-6 DNA methylase [Desulfuromonadales bacterium]|nr:N-6 DNA methylase [Desulfuromonadales bacterium]